MITENIDKLVALKKPAIRLQLQKVGRNDRLNSKFGGLPNVDPDDFKWPRYNDNPLAFLGQIDLAEMTELERYEWVPATGYLLFFYDIIEQCGGYDVEEKASWRVIYQENPSVMAAYPDDIDVEAKFDEQYLIGSKVHRFPQIADHIHIPSTDYDLSEPEFQTLLDLKHEEFDAENPYHQFGGYPTEPEFNSLKLTAHLNLNGTSRLLSNDQLNLSDKGIEESGVDSGSEQAKGDAMKKLKVGADDWELLLQLDSDTTMSDAFTFGDGAKLFFYVQKEMARKKNFSDCWMMLQII